MGFAAWRLSPVQSGNIYSFVIIGLFFMMLGMMAFVIIFNMMNRYLFRHVYE